MTTAIRSEVHRLARQGRLVDEAFKNFQRMVYPGAGPDQVREMRVCFFAGAAEIYALMMATLTDDPEPTDDDMAFMQGCTDEITRFHERTMAVSRKPKGSA